MRDHLGPEYSGTVTGVASFGLFVQLENLFVEGMVHVTDLGADYFQFDDARHELRGERTGMRYQLTDRVTVQVSRVDLDARRIDLRLVTEPGIRTQLKNEARQATGKRDKHEKRDTQGPGKTVKSKAKATKTVSKTAAKNGKKKR